MEKMTFLLRNEQIRNNLIEQIKNYLSTTTTPPLYVSPTSTARYLKTACSTLCAVTWRVRLYGCSKGERRCNGKRFSYPGIRWQPAWEQK